MAASSRSICSARFTAWRASWPSATGSVTARLGSSNDLSSDRAHVLERLAIGPKTLARGRSSLGRSLRDGHAEFTLRDERGSETAGNATEGSSPGDGSGGKAERPNGLKLDGDLQNLTRIMPAEGNRPAGPYVLVLAGSLDSLLLRVV